LDHLNTLNALENVALAYLILQKPEEAHPYFKRAGRYWSQIHELSDIKINMKNNTEPLRDKKLDTIPIKDDLFIHKSNSLNQPYRSSVLAFKITLYIYAVYKIVPI
jgi:hypothetical protein